MILQSSDMLFVVVTGALLLILVWVVYLLVTLVQGFFKIRRR